MCQVYTRERSQELEEKLSNFLGSHRLTITNDTDIVSVCKNLNINALYMPLDETMDGFILVNRNYRVIAIKESLEALDVRFLIAHELAHYITAYDETLNSNQILIAAKRRCDMVLIRSKKSTIWTIWLRLY